MCTSLEPFIQQLYLAANWSLGSGAEDFKGWTRLFFQGPFHPVLFSDFENDKAEFDLKAFNSEECKFSGSSKCNLVPQNTSGFPLENTMRNMEGNGKTGTKKHGSSLEKNDRQLNSKRSKKVGQISSKENRIEETENKEPITGSTSQQAHWGRTSQNIDAQEGILEPDANLDYETEISDSTRSADASESSRQIKHKRTPCMYGSGCYR